MDVRRAYQASQLVRVHGEAMKVAGGRLGAPAPRSDPSVHVVISRPAGVLSKLASLQDADASRFKQRMGEVGSNLKAAANPQSGAIGSELGVLADQLLHVAKTGDLSALQPVSRQNLSSTQRALEAYRRSAQPPAAASATVAQALDYVLSAAQQR